MEPPSGSITWTRNNKRGAGDADCLRAKKNSHRYDECIRNPLCVRTGAWWDQWSVHLVTFTDSILLWCSLFFPFINFHSGSLCMRKKLNCLTFLIQKYLSVTCLHLSHSACVFAYSLFICPPEQGVFSYLWPLKVQGWRAITKTALSITLTDRLKRGFNSYSSPWALHHRGRYPLTPLLSPFIVSSCQSLGGLAKWPLLLLRSRYCVLSYPLGCGLERHSNSTMSLIVELKGWRRVARQDITPLTTH